MKYFCTYKNGETKGQWTKSREYESTEAMFNAMMPYIEKHPRTLVQYQTTR